MPRPKTCASLKPKAPRIPTILGLDLSLNAPAAVVLYKGWQPGDWKIRSKCWKSEIETHRKWHADAYDPAWWPVERLDYVADRIVAFALDNGITDLKGARVFVENYAFGLQTEVLAELGGAIKLAFYKRASLLLEYVPVSSARKTLLGFNPTKKKLGVDPKDYVNGQLAKMGAKFDTMDEGDAFVIANHGRMLLGLPHIGLEHDT